MQVTRYLTAAALGGAALISTAASAQKRPISMDECLQLALQHNLDVQIERFNPTIARENLSGAYGAYDPVLSVRYSHDYSLYPPTYNTSINQNVQGAQTGTDTYSLGLGGVLPTGLSYNFSATAADSDGQHGFVVGTNIFSAPFTSANSSAGVTLSQPLLKNFWIDGNRLTVALNRRSLQISELGLRQRIITTVASVEIAYFQLIAARDSVKVQEIALQLAEQLLTENRKRVEVGVLAPLDEKQAQSQVESSRSALLGARNTVIIQENTLKNLLTDKFAEWQDVEIEPTEKLKAVPQTFSRQDSWSKGLTLRPDLLQLKIDMERRNITLKYDKNQLFPQLDVTGSYGRIGSSDNLWDSLGGVRDAAGDRFSYGVMLSVPLSNRQAKTRYRAAKEDIEQALLRLKQSEQTVMVQIDNAISQARTSLQQVDSTKAAVEYADQALQAEQKKLENGKSTNFQVLQLQRDLTSRQFEYLTALTTYNIALASLAQNEGTTLERNHINLELH